MKGIVDAASDHTGFVRVLQEEAEQDDQRSMAGRPYAYSKIRPEIYAERATADYLLAPSEHVRQSLIADGVPLAKIQVIPYGVDHSFFTPSANPADEDRPFTALFVGVVGYRKGIRYLLQAWDELKLKRARLILVGALDGVLDLTHHANVIVAGNVTRTRVREYMQQADVFVFPSLIEGSALVVYEAMACGLPVITTPMAGSVVRDGIDGFIVPPRDVATLQSRLAELYQRRDICHEMGRSAYTYVVQNYTWNHYGDRLVQFYQKTVFSR
jgi:glycosyltransferase involved in cell wall biosynthesis